MRVIVNAFNDSSSPGQDNHTRLDVFLPITVVVWIHWWTQRLFDQIFLGFSFDKVENIRSLSEVFIFSVLTYSVLVFSTAVLITVVLSFHYSIMLPAIRHWKLLWVNLEFNSTGRVSECLARAWKLNITSTSGFIYRWGMNDMSSCGEG